MSQYGNTSYQKQFFFEKKYQITGTAWKDTEHSAIYPVRCLCIPGCPNALLKLYRGRDLTKLYTRLQSINYASWAAVYDVAYFDFDTYIITEYIPGITLADLLAQRKAHHTALAPTEAADLMLALCDSVRILHGLNPPIIHRDLKPANILLPFSAKGQTVSTSFSKIKLLDFDTAREYTEDKTRDTVFMGTRQYAAPEQLGLASFGQTDARSDIYAAGLIFYEMLYGHLPSAQDLQHMKRSHPFSGVILKCTHFQPNERYLCMDELISDITQIQNHRFSFVLNGDPGSLRLASCNPACNPLFASCMPALLIALSIPFDPLFPFAAVFFWIEFITLIVLRCSMRAKHPHQIRFFSSFLFWLLYFVFLFVIFFLLAFFLI